MNGNSVELKGQRSVLSCCYSTKDPPPQGKAILRVVLAVSAITSDILLLSFFVSIILGKDLDEVSAMPDENRTERNFFEFLEEYLSETVGAA